MTGLVRDFTVKKRGTDTSGRPIYATNFMWSVWLMILADRRIRPFAHKLVIVQGAFMERVKGGGAKASQGYHDKAGCLDVRTWNLSEEQLDLFIWVAAEYGWCFWRRDAEHGGMEEHAHGVLGTDRPLTPGAQSQWDGPHGYLNGGDGLAGGGRDYEKRPKPLVTEPPEDPMEALIKDLTAVCIKHSVTRVYGARALLYAAWRAAKGLRKKLLRAARVPLVGMDDPK